MTPPDSQGGISYRVQQLEKQVERQNAEIHSLRSTVYSAGYKIAGAIVVASLTFAIGMLRLLG